MRRRRRPQRPRGERSRRLYAPPKAGVQAAEQWEAEQDVLDGCATCPSPPCACPELIFFARTSAVLGPAGVGSLEFRAHSSTDARAVDLPDVGPVLEPEDLPRALA